MGKDKPKPAVYGGTQTTSRLPLDTALRSAEGQLPRDDGHSGSRQEVRSRQGLAEQDRRLEHHGRFQGPGHLAYTGFSRSHAGD